MLNQGQIAMPPTAGEPGESMAVHLISIDCIKNAHLNNEIYYCR